MRKNRLIPTKELFSFFQDFIHLGGDDFFGRKKGRMIVEEAGRQGGLRNSATHGEKFHSEIGRKRVRIGGPKRRTKSTPPYPERKGMKKDNYTLL